MKSRYIYLAWLAQKWGEEIGELPAIIGDRIVGWVAHGAVDKDSPGSILGEAFLLTDGTPVSPVDLRLALSAARNEGAGSMYRGWAAQELNKVLIRTEHLGRFCRELNIVPPRCVFGRVASTVGHLRDGLMTPPEPPDLPDTTIPSPRNELFADDVAGADAAKPGSDLGAPCSEQSLDDTAPAGPSHRAEPLPRVGRKLHFESRKQAIFKELDRMSSDGKLSFDRGGLTDAAKLISQKFPGYQLDSIRKMIQKPYRDLKKHRAA